MLERVLWPGAGEDDDEVDTEPQEYPAVARSTITSVIKKSAVRESDCLLSETAKLCYPFQSTPSGAYERLDLGDPVTKTYVQSLLSGDDENFNSFTVMARCCSSSSKNHTIASRTT